MEQTVLFATKWIELLANQHGEAFVKMGDGVLMVPFTPQREIIFLREYSVAYDRPMLLLPGGAIENGESEKSAVNRELQEEIGFKTATIDYLGVIHPHSKYLQWRFKVFLVRDLLPSKLQGDERWEMEMVRVPLHKVTAAIARGKITDATIIATMYMAQNFIAARQL